ncbi:MAG: NADH-quinone oxidoreductase subunit H [Bacteroidetes bacterium]|nr:NADH-quinone oxidoreductase subunit H [Bacteroidota bacterium]
MISVLLTILSALFFPGLISITKAKMSGRKGPTVFQPISDIIRLLKKGSVYSTTTSWIFQFSPTIYFATIIGATLMIPFGNHQTGLISFEGDFLFFAYMLALGKFLMIVSALDTGSGFEGMGANREALYSMLVEPAFFVIIASLALLSGHTSFHEMFISLQLNDYTDLIYMAVVIFIILQISLIENSRLPIDDPKTHLELTMVHEVMVLDNSGFDMGIIQIAGAIKFAIYGGIISNLIISPLQLDMALSASVFVIVQMMLAITIGILESFKARLKMTYNPQYILTLLGMALLAFFTVLIMTQTL